MTDTTKVWLRSDEALAGGSPAVVTKVIMSGPPGPKGDPGEVSGAAVTSFNGRAGAVSLTKLDVTATGLAAADIGAATTGSLAGEITRATTAEATNATAISSEAATARAAESANAIAIATEATSRATADGLRQLLSEKGQANGYAALDGSGTVPDAQLPATLARDAEVTTAVAAEAAARTAAITAAIAALVNSAPGLMDTLAEIDAALNNDPNFAATMTAALNGKQGVSAQLTALAGLVSAADTLPYFTGAGAAALTTFTTFARTLLAATSAAGGRTALGLGDASTHPAADFATAAQGAKADSADQAGFAAADKTRLAGTSGANTGDQDLSGLIAKSLVTAKGQLIVATGSGTVAPLTVGSDGQVLTADAASAAGVKWAASAAGGNTVAPLITGRFYDQHVTEGTRTFAGTAASFIIYGVLLPQRTMTITKLGVCVGSAVGASTCRVAIYSSSGGVPANLIVESGSLATTATGVVTATIASTTLTAGTLYFVAVQTSTASNSLMTVDPRSLPMVGMTGSTPNNGSISRYFQSFALAAFPASATSPSPTITDAGSNSMACVLMGV